MIVQLCGMSGAGKSTLAKMTRQRLAKSGIAAEILDGDEYRKSLCRDLGFSKEDRCENIRRLGFVASRMSAHGIVAIICAINPYNEIRKELVANFPNVFTVFVDCELSELLKRDTKGLYRKALLPAGHPDKIDNLTGINDPFDIPTDADLRLLTNTESREASAWKLLSLITGHLSAQRTRLPEIHRLVTV